MKEVLLIDNYDSFTWNIYHYALQVGIPCILHREDELTWDRIERMNPAGFIFSPGPGKPSDHPLMQEIIQKKPDCPILGVCLGHQAIGEFFGARLIKSDVPTHGKICRIRHTGHKMFEGVPEYFFVGRYHSLLLGHIPEKYLTITAVTDSGLPMAIAHKSLPVWGVQFHPESILSEGGLQIFRNWHVLIEQEAMF
jgi:anthranilate synthase/aminodeoxychorismate synthase-like glutamine amidotransferase